MEGERYNLGKAQEDADKLRKKVEAGKASSYGDAEKLTDEEIAKAKERMTNRLKNGYTSQAIEIRDKFALPEEFIQSPEVQEAAKEGMIVLLKKDDIDRAIGIKDEFALSEEIVQEVAKEMMIYWLKDGEIDCAVEIRDKFALSEEIVQEVAKEMMIYWLKNGVIKQAIKIKDKFAVSEEIVQEAAKEGMIYWLEDGKIDKAIRVKDEFALSEEIVQEAAKERMINRLKNGDINRAIEIKDKFALPEEIFQSSEVQETIKERMINRLKKGETETIEIKDEFALPEEFIQSPEVQEATKEGMIFCLKNGVINQAIKIKDKFAVSEEIIQSPEVQKAVRERMIDWLEDGKIDKAIRVKDEFALSEEIVQSSEVQKAAKEGVFFCLRYSSADEAIKIKTKFAVSEEIVQEASIKGIIYGLKNGFIDRAIEIKDKLILSEEFIQSLEVQEAIKGRMISLLEYGDIDRAIEIKTEFAVSEEIVQEVAIKGMIYGLERNNINNAIKIKDGFALSEKIVKTAKIFCNIDVSSLEKEVTNLEDLTEEQLAEMFKLARKEFPAWQDEQTIAGPFQAGAETFGYKRMLEYINRKDLSLHDAVHAFPDVLELFKTSGLGESEFYGQVLQQVRMDDREYSEGTAHHHLNAIAQTANKNVSEVIAKVQEYKEIEKLQELVATFNTPQAVFTSWTNLKRYSELEQLLGQSEVLDELKELKSEGKDKLYKYIETLAFHPDSKVDMGAVMEFWRDPESFFAAGASHTPTEIHDRKKPSNYINMPNLDLSALELRDALVEGKMDNLSVFTPLEVRYTIPMEEVKQEPLPDLVNKALGSNKKGIEGAGRNSKKLFNELGKLLKPHGLSVVDYIQGKFLPEGVNLSHQIETLLYDRDFGMERPLVKTKEFVARISKKSDPEGAIAGDDTVNCMPFGDGKNTVYTFNPNTAQFVIRIVKSDGKERTIAQSVLTKDMDIKTSIPGVLSKLEQEGGHLEDILPADILSTAPVYATCDNVEVSPNYSDGRHQQIIETIFRDFFKEYMSKYAVTEGLNASKVPIGQGYTDALSQLPSEANTFAPQAPVSYSDKTGSNVYMLDLKSEKGLDLIWQKTVKESGVQRRIEPSLPKIKGLDYLTFEDTLKVGYIEGKAYSDNQSMMQFLFNIENGLIAKDINNSAKDRPNMSIKYTDDSGRMRGYLLAWEGKLDDENVENDTDEFYGKPCIYIIDVASDRENRLAGGRLIQGFAELYKQNYLDKGKVVPIYAQARETTSYQIVKKQLDKLGKDAGFNFELVELPTYEVGEDVMHPIIIRPLAK